MPKIGIVDQTRVKIIGDILVHNLEDAGMDKQKLDNIELVPEEGYTNDTSKDGSKRFACKQCSKIFKSEGGAKQHIASVHMNKKPKGIKRTSTKNDSSSGKANKKKNLIE